MHRIRSVKTAEEVAQMRKAVAITGKAFERVCGFLKPGVMEYAVEAEITHEFLRNGSRGHAYTPIIASGYSACVLHYIDNDKPCKDGDVILMDFGCEYGGYASDLTRCLPVNGKFTKRQRDVYNAVLNVKNEATKLLRPGTMLAEYHKEVGKLMESELIGLGLLDKTDVKNQNPDASAVQEVLHARHQPLHRAGCTRCGPVERTDPRRHVLHRGAGDLHPRGEPRHPVGERHPGDQGRTGRPVQGHSGGSRCGGGTDEQEDGGGVVPVFRAGQIRMRMDAHSSPHLSIDRGQVRTRNEAMAFYGNALRFPEACILLPNPITMYIRSVGIAALILGTLFKVLHWPGANIMILTGGVVAGLAAIAVLVMKPGPKPASAVLRTVTGALLIAFLLFKLFHLPFADAWVLAAVVSSVGLLFVERDRAPGCSVCCRCASPRSCSRPSHLWWAEASSR